MSIHEVAAKHHHQNLANHHKLKIHFHKRLFGFSSAIVGFGLVALLVTYGVSVASTPRKFAIAEPESGTRAGGANVIDEGGASGGKYIKFAPPTTSPPPTTPPPTTPPSSGGSTTKVRRFPGDPNPKVYGKAYWGSSIGGNGDPSKHETPAGASLSIRRTFYQWSDATNLNSSMYSTVSSDLAKNRLPFVSIKTPGWKTVADGNYDSSIDAMLRKLDSYGKPVWLVVHHEPEGGGASGNTPDDPGGAPEWRRMQSKIRERINAVKTKNVAFMPILMSYTWNNASGRTPNDWWVAGIWDAYCVDHYRDNTNGDMFSAQWPTFVSWVEAKGLPFCVGEWGNRGADAQAATEMQQFWDWSFTNKKDFIGYAYFDSGLNSPTGTWELTGEPLNKFRDILKNDTRVQRIGAL